MISLTTELKETRNDVFRQIAYLSISSSVLCLIILFTSMGMLIGKTNELRYNVNSNAYTYSFRADILWTEIQKVRAHLPPIIRFTRNVFNDPFAHILTQCNRCTRLACPTGTIGLPGPPGDDGIPGKTGDQGQPGEDGFDVQQEPTPDLPCSVCPAGPPGPRGIQGERGWIGQPGVNGEAGPPGRPAQPGGEGEPGGEGSPGLKGTPGEVGQRGDNIIAGIGVRGPKGQPGAPGFQGPIGLPGRPSNVIGPSGKQGETGPQGMPGNNGLDGHPGIFGPPGEGGAISNYCPTDCGVTKIVAPSTHMGSHNMFPFMNHEIGTDDYDTSPRGDNAGVDETPAGNYGGYGRK